MQMFLFWCKGEHEEGRHHHQCGSRLPICTLNKRWILHSSVKGSSRGKNRKKSMHQSFVKSIFSSFITSWVRRKNRWHIGISSWRRFRWWHCGLWCFVLEQMRTPNTTRNGERNLLCSKHSSALSSSRASWFFIDAMSCLMFVTYNNKKVRVYSDYFGNWHSTTGS